MFCNQCGSQLIEGASFCQKCGAKVPGGVTEQEVSVPINNMQRQEESILSGKQHQDDAVIKGQNIEQVRGSEADQNLKECIDKHVKETTGFQSAE